MKKPTVTHLLSTLVFVVGAGFSAISLDVQAQDVKGSAAAGQAKVWLCAGCHAIPDYRADYPLVYRVPKLADKMQPTFTPLWKRISLANVSTPPCAQ